MATTWKWALGNFSNGNLIGEEVETELGDSVSFDIDDSMTSAEVTVILSKLTASQRNNWRATFKPVARYMALIRDVDGDKTVIFAGFINKTNNPIGDGKLKIQLTSLSEYMKSRLVIDEWTQVTDPTSSRTFEADSWRGVMAEIVRACFSTSGIPSGAPKPPQVLGTTPSTSGTTRKTKILKTDAMSYYDALAMVAEESGNGQEWKFVPRFDGTSRIVWDLVLGTNATPQINSEDIHVVQLDATSKLSAYGKTIDSSSLFTKLYSQSKQGDEEKKEGADLSMAYAPAAENPILLETFQGINEEIDSNEMSAQLSSRMQDSGNFSTDVDLTMENTNTYLWVTRLGAMLQIHGYVDTISADFNDFLRIVSVEFTPAMSTVRIGLQEKQVRYRKLPKKKVKDLVQKDESKKTPPLSETRPPTGGGGGGGDVPTPPQPWEPGNPENPGDGGPGASWGMDSGSEIATTPVYNTKSVSPMAVNSGTLPWGNSNSTSTQAVIQNESNIIHCIQNLSIRSKSYTFAEAPTFPIGLGLGQISNSTIWSAFLQEGEIRDAKKISEPYILSDTNIQAMLADAGVHSLWARPAPVEITGTPGNVSFWYVRSVSIQAYVSAAVSIGAKLIVPVNVTVTWQRDNAASNGNAPTDWNNNSGMTLTQYFSTFFEANYVGTDLVSEFTHKSGFGHTGAIRLGHRVGSFYVFLKNGSNVVYSLNMGNPQGLEQQTFVSPPSPSGEPIYLVHFGQLWNLGLCFFIMTSGSNIYYYQLPAGVTSPVVEGAWTQLAITGAGGIIRQKFLTAFNGKPIYVPDPSSSGSGAYIADGGSNSWKNISPGSYWSNGFCYRNYFYATGNLSGSWQSFRMDYTP